MRSLFEGFEAHSRAASYVNYEGGNETGAARSGRSCPKEAKRKLALRRFWEDDLQAFRNGHDDLGTDRPFPDLTDQQLATHLKGMPMVGYLSGLFTQRYLNAATIWRHNDLLDMLYLPCAAGYADFVAAEAHTGRQLAQMQRSRGMTQTVFTTLHDLVEALIESGAQTAAERGAE